jgi:hypothetical protein
MGNDDKALRTAPSQLRSGLWPDRNAAMPTPERRAIERIKRKATGMAIAAASERPVAEVLEAPRDLAPEPVAPRLARKCRCADAEVMAYRDGTEWWCHTCGYELTAHASRELSIGARIQDSNHSSWQKCKAREDAVA